MKTILILFLGILIFYSSSGFAQEDQWSSGSDWLSFTASVNHRIEGTISGADPDLNPMMMPLFDPANSGRQQLDLGVGANFYVPSGAMKNIRIGAEVKFPMYQHVNGIQMKNKAMTTLGIQYSM